MLRGGTCVWATRRWPELQLHHLRKESNLKKITFCMSKPSYLSITRIDCSAEKGQMKLWRWPVYIFTFKSSIIRSEKERFSLIQDIEGRGIKIRMTRSNKMAYCAHLATSDSNKTGKGRNTNLPSPHLWVQNIFGWYSSLGSLWGMFDFHSWFQICFL